MTNEPKQNQRPAFLCIASTLLVAAAWSGSAAGSGLEDRLTAFTADANAARICWEIRTNPLVPTPRAQISCAYTSPSGLVNEMSGVSPQYDPGPEPTVVVIVGTAGGVCRLTGAPPSPLTCSLPATTGYVRPWVPEGTGAFLSISGPTGSGAVCGAKEDGSVECVTPNGTSFRAIAAGPPIDALSVDYSICVLRAGSLDCSDSLGQALPSIPNAFPGRTVSSIANAHDGACALDSNGEVACIGVAPPPSNLRFRTLAAGTSGLCGITTSGQLSCWGCPSKWAADCAAPTGTFAYLAVGARQSCAIGTTGELICWGGRDFPAPLTVTRFTQLLQ